jgi:glutamate synthase (NADPH/NADH)
MYGVLLVSYFLMVCFQILMADLRAEHEVNNKSVVVANGSIDGVGNVHTGSVSGITDEDLAKIWGGDRRLSLFSYTIETINLLLLPMIRTK